MTHHPLRRTAAALLAAGLVLGGGLLVTAPASAVVTSVTPTPADVDGLPSPGPTTTPPIFEDPVGCAAALTVTSRWDDGFVASVRVRNLSMFYATDSWVVTVDLPRGRIANAWNAIPGGTSPQTFTPAPWSPVVGLTGSTEFGFLASGSPDDASLTCAWP